MSEANTRHTVVDNFRLLGADCQRIEDAYSVGIPDLNLCWRGTEGWIEFKHLDLHDLPKRPSTPVRIGLKPEQALWLTTRHRHGGRVGVLTKIEPRTWLFHLWMTPEGVTIPGFGLLKDGLPLSNLCTLAALYWTGDFKSMAREVLTALLGSR